MKVYFIGIGGFGMSGLAENAIQSGHTVSGSDAIRTFITERLERLGIKINYSQSPENITEDIDVVIYSSAIKPGHPEYDESIKKNLKLIRRAEYLGELVNDKYLIAVSGTHGKTTTSAMIAKVLIESGLDPTVFVGGTMDFLEGGTSKTGSGNIAVVEADEYDRSFLSLKPDILIITGIEADHSDIYNNIEEIKEAFSNLIKNIKPGGKLIVYGEDNNTREVCGKNNLIEALYYGFSENNTIRAVNIVNSNGTSYEFWTGRKTIGKCSLAVIGDHNVLNSLAAFIAAGFAGVTMQEFVNQIIKFKGVGRRLELKYSGGIKVYDDYAHHPTEIFYSINSIKKNMRETLIVVFQPHLYTRTRDFYKEFALSLSKADFVILLEIYPAREQAIEGVNSGIIAGELEKHMPGRYVYVKNNEQLKYEIQKVIKPGNVLMFQGAGNVTNYCENYISQIN